MCDLENAHTAFVLNLHYDYVNDWMRSQNIRWFFSFYSWILWWCLIIFNVLIFNFMSSVTLIKLPPATVWLVQLFQCFLWDWKEWIDLYVCLSSSRIKGDTNHLQISAVGCQTRAVLLLAKQFWLLAHHILSRAAGSDATPCKLIFTRTRARLPFLYLPIANTLL